MLMIHRSPKPIQMEWHLLRRFWAAPGNKRWIFGTFFFPMRKFPNEVQHWMDMLDCESASSTTPFYLGQKGSLSLTSKLGSKTWNFSHWRKAGIKGIQNDTYTLNTTCICWLTLALRPYLFYFSKASQPICFSCSLPCITHKCGFSKTI